MCGIAGIAGKHARRFSPALVAMREAIAHRGPDAQGEQFFENCALGHTRLSIIDLSTGDQPFAYGKNISVVFNGELYGYKELRARLSVPLRSTSDTELIPALYTLYGVACVPRLPGMFAFALWDDREQRLLCARDRFGEKPLYYAHTDDGSLVFASEIKAIIRSGLVRPVINRTAVANFLTLRYVPEGMTIYRDVHSLPPGHALVHENDNTTVFPYWQPPAPMEHPPSPEEAAEEFRTLMTRAVRGCLVADVEVGLLLSGGLDSTTIAAHAVREMPLRSFAFGFAGPRDERPFAREVAIAYGLDHVELADDVLDLPAMLMTLCRVYDEPFADSSALPTYMLCRRVREHVKVALTGDGGDELLAGYDYWYGPLAGATDPQGGRVGWSRSAERHWADVTHFSEAEIADMQLPRVQRPRIVHASGSVDDAMRLDIATFLPADILKKIDRAAMAHGLELRAPFLDNELASFLISLPWQFKTDGTRHKIIMRQAFAEIWPESIRRRGKQGFGTSVRDWLLHPDMQPLRAYYLLGRKRRIRSLLPGEQVDRHATNTAHKGWHMLVLAAWLEHSPWELG
ncbi:asparagine synthase (glutamine-hydrolyzing) [Desulfomicrobium baculatum]|uniref:asparagine synthase (glutamine-hydrolyzing) n=1 Tax=Desulfomicrobium baculatum (strain DSM 4028 / VKM B-1378 / X) TaxID=525897 RepID=C7LT29_DESBD|nr:asparagine synthase (glutamine-hydrolyzing) [Desulfomicrobium baculatum]ACU88253.1 asparagine synthase (glutamine-hydrolyzing) [Desulfomicrobium baculatum DSM 4028]